MNVLTCSKCSADAVPVKIVNKLDYYALVLFCPECHKKTNTELSFNVQDWIKDVAASYFLCDYCGYDNRDNWRYKDELAPSVGIAPVFMPYPRPFRGPRPPFRRPFHPYWGPRPHWRVHPMPFFDFHHNMERVKIVFKCPNCGKKRAKVADRKLWPQILRINKFKEIQETVETREQQEKLQFECEQCGTILNEDDTSCPNCGAFLRCTCGAPIVPNAIFCLKCGQRFEDIKPPIKELECPCCGEPVNEDLSFCRRCGQEIKCDKCGNPIVEGSNYCIVCGDPVQKGNK
ncbi:MAG: double zinc ribbon domain-containing protein [Candidatus Helarchaeota archaeon]